MALLFLFCLVEEDDRELIEFRDGYILVACAVYCVVWIQPRVSSLVVTHRTSEIRVMPDRPFTLGLVPLEISTSISGSHPATYVVNACVS